VNYITYDAVLPLTPNRNTTKVPSTKKRRQGVAGNGAVPQDPTREWYEKVGHVFFFFFFLTSYVYRMESNDNNEITPVSLANATGWFSLVFGETTIPTHHPMHAATSTRQQQEQGEVCLEPGKLYLSFFIYYILY
jgi:hypothetical protein